MLRAVLVVSILFSASACKDPEGTPTPAPKSPSTKKADAGGTTGQPAPASDEADEVAAEAGEDRSCDPAEKGACLEGETCMGKPGCEVVWQCDEAVTCKKGVREYCGCDGKTFESEYGNCPTKKYQYAGPCK